MGLNSKKYSLVIQTVQVGAQKAGCVTCVVRTGGEELRSVKMLTLQAHRKWCRILTYTNTSAYLASISLREEEF